LASAATGRDVDVDERHDVRDVPEKERGQPDDETEVCQRDFGAARRARVN